MKSDSVTYENEQVEANVEQVAFPSSDVEHDYGQAIENVFEMQLFLYEDQSIVQFEGEGNEFTSFSIKTTWLNDHYVRYEQDNGEVILVKYYRVLKDGIYLIEQLADETSPKTVSELENLPVRSTMLQAPIAVGTTFEGWTIEAIDGRYPTPFKAFDEVIVLTKKIDTIEERQYFVAGIGAIADEFEITEKNAEKTVIASRIQLISY